MCRTSNGGEVEVMGVEVEVEVARVWGWVKGGAAGECVRGGADGRFGIEW